MLFLQYGKQEFKFLPVFLSPESGKVGQQTKFKYLLTLSLFLKVLTLILEKVEFQDLYYQMQVTRHLKF